MPRHGDVVKLTGTTGAVTRSYDYDAFGNQKNADALDVNPFRYCGEYWDAETETYYLRARYYDPGTGRFLAEDPIKDGLNWYSYCYNNPIIFADANGTKPYSVRDRNGKYSLFVSTQYQDAAESIVGAIPVYGWIYSVANDIAQRTIGGFREIDYDASGLMSTIVSAAGLVNDDVLKVLSKWGGRLLTAIEGAAYLYDWFYAHNYQIEEAIYNHFDRDIWVSSSRNVVDMKFEYAMEEMLILILEGKVGVAKAIDIFGKDAFHNSKQFGMVTYQHDPLTGEKKLFRQGEYYFYIIDDSASGAVADIGNTIDTRRRWV